MATPEQIAALLAFRDAAKAAGHIWPVYAACEAALESDWGESQLAIQGKNLFGQKQHPPAEAPLFTTLKLPTREYTDAGWVDEIAMWVCFPTIADSFTARMTTLKDMSHFYPEYARALAASTGEAYVAAVSARWSTDPQRGAKVLEIYRAHQDVLGPAMR